MGKKLKHSHIAVRGSIVELAHAAKAKLAEGEDDLGRYRYFDLVFRDEHGAIQTIRFASHHGDAMVHVLAENINAVDELAEALFNVGISTRAKISISTNQNDEPLRDINELMGMIVAVRKLSQIQSRNEDSVSPLPKVARVFKDSVGSRASYPKLLRYNPISSVEISPSSGPLPNSRTKSSE